jgi:hypothetical protein
LVNLDDLLYDVRIQPLVLPPQRGHGVDLALQPVLKVVAPQVCVHELDLVVRCQESGVCGLAFGDELVPSACGGDIYF